VKRARLLLASGALLLANGAHASWFEFCDIEGEIEKVERPSKTEYALTVHVAQAVRAKEDGDSSYTDCHEHDDEHLQAYFLVRELPRAPHVGDVISFSRSAVDGFSQSGAFAGTSVRTTLHALHARSRTNP